MRKLPSAELNVYVQRINELAHLSHEQEPNPEETVEWLVRCVEDPATRWEGAFDLASSAQSLRASFAQNDSNEDSVNEINQSTEAPGLGNDAELAALLTQDQKERLMKVLLSADEVTEGDRDLIELLKDFNDPRLLSFLVSQLRRTEDNPPEATRNIVRVVAELLNNKRITANAESYRDAYYDDEDEEDTNEDHDTAKTQAARARKRSTQMRLFLQQVERIMRGRNFSAEEK